MPNETTKQVTKDIKIEKIKNTVYAYIDDLYMADGIKGCPMGRGREQETAITDLQYRIKFESNVELGVRDIILM